jgi:broad specificity phosphatase PhoE
MTARLSLIAHAATQAQRSAAFPLDEPVIEGEKTKAATQDAKLPRADRVWCAPEQRTRQTSLMLGFDAVTEERLRDCDYGRWRGRKMEEVQAEDPDGLMAWLSSPGSVPHGGESVEGLISRMGGWMDEQDGMKHTIAISHPAVIKAAIVYALHLEPKNFWRFDIAPLSLTDLRLNGRVWTVRCCGCPLSAAHVL